MTDVPRFTKHPCLTDPFITLAWVNFTRGPGNFSARPMAVHKWNDWVSKFIMTNKYWEIRDAAEITAGTLFDTSTVFARSSKREHVFLDVGANVGYFSLLFADRGFRVVAIEPMKRNRMALEQTLCMNPDLRARVHIVDAALGDHKDIVGGLSCVIRSQRLMNLGG
uniref:tRNA(Phe) (4-demethylwyosine(37)-C(7)) aminocarboxypropyltransferase n=1 Tax=Haptolina brevifila TaxID=156173 RepID=A0A7S2NHD2_9EUKA|mmetsp:Transcript_78648/g.156357  ORF Transcript_78648/g.156357 Transcript_78648/m.156357 type:complete len:166 (+) Transcript_78648:9-506(+)